MRWSPLVVFSTVLAATSSFAAPLDVVLENRASTLLASTKPKDLFARSDPVKVTPGPKGKNVVIDKKFGAPTITKDGVTIAKEIELHGHSHHTPGAALVKKHK